MNVLKEWFHQKKDASVSFLLEKAAQHKLAKYGRMLNLSIDSRQKSARIELLLKGESEPMIILVHEYELISEENGAWMVIRRLSISREWADTMAAEFVVGRKIPVPDKYVQMLRLLT
jgi:hypothetical protein